jgi:hypothetical protein
MRGRPASGASSDHTWSSVFDRTMRHPRIVAILRDCSGPAVRWEIKLNVIARLRRDGRVASGTGVHPQTNDDLCAVGVMMDDCALENGPLLISGIWGSGP